MSLLDEICLDTNAAGKGADLNNPLPPIQMPRGYGGVAIMWKSCLGRYVTVLQDGSERIQCIELGIKATSQRSTLLISVYVPCKGYSTSASDFFKCVDELFEIVSKYANTHNILIGTDLNEDLNIVNSDKRSTYIHEFIREYSLSY